MEINRRATIVTGISLAIGIAEALIYFNLGENAERPTGQKFKFRFPAPKQFLETVVVVIITSMATAALSNYVESVIPEEKMVSEKKEDKPKAI